MPILDRRKLKHDAERALSCAANQKTLVLIWAAVSAGLPLLVSVLSFMLDNQIAQTGGLAGFDQRSILSTIQSALDTLTTIVLPFWTLGYTAAVMRFARQQNADQYTLLEGFRRFGPALRSFLLKGFLFVMICIACFYAGITLLSMTPIADPVWAILEESQTMFLSGVMDEAVLAETADAMMPMFWICCGLCLIVITPVFYHLRLTDYCILDASHGSALLAMHESRRLMHRKRLALFRLDLSFWWFYLAQLLLIAVCYGDTILPRLGVTLPFSENAAYFIFYIVSLLAQFLLMYLYSNQVQTTYVLFYDSLRTPPEEETALTI